MLIVTVMVSMWGVPPKFPVNTRILKRQNENCNLHPSYFEWTACRQTECGWRKGSSSWGPFLPPDLSQLSSFPTQCPSPMMRCLTLVPEQENWLSMHWYPWKHEIIFPPLGCSGCVFWSKWYKKVTKRGWVLWFSIPLFSFHTYGYNLVPLLLR